MDLSKFFLCISCPFSNKAQMRFAHGFIACWSFCFKIKLLNESKYSTAWVDCAFDNVLTLNLNWIYHFQSQHRLERCSFRQFGCHINRGHRQGQVVLPLLFNCHCHCDLNRFSNIFFNRRTMTVRGKVLRDGRYRITYHGQEMILEANQTILRPNNRIAVAPGLMSRLMEMADQNQVLSCWWKSSQEQRLST